MNRKIGAGMCTTILVITMTLVVLKVSNESFFNSDDSVEVGPVVTEVSVSPGPPLVQHDLGVVNEASPSSIELSDEVVPLSEEQPVADDFRSALEKKNRELARRIRINKNAIKTDLSLSTEFLESVGVAEGKKQAFGEVMREVRAIQREYEKSAAVVIDSGGESIGIYVPLPEVTDSSFSRSNLYEKLNDAIGSESNRLIWEQLEERINKEFSFFQEREQEVLVTPREGRDDYLIEQTFTAENGNIRTTTYNIDSSELNARFGHLKIWQ